MWTILGMKMGKWMVGREVHNVKHYRSKVLKKYFS